MLAIPPADRRHVSVVLMGNAELIALTGAHLSPTMLTCGVRRTSIPHSLLVYSRDLIALLVA